MLLGILNGFLGIQSSLELTSMISELETLSEQIFSWLSGAAYLEWTVKHESLRILPEK